MSAAQLTAIKERIETVASAKKINLLETPIMADAATTQTTTGTSETIVVTVDATAASTSAQTQVNSTVTGNPIVDANLEASPGPAAPVEGKADGKEVAAVEGMNKTLETPGSQVPAAVEGGDEPSPTVPADKYMEVMKAYDALKAEHVGVTKQLTLAQSQMTAMSGAMEKQNMLVKALSDALVAWIPQNTVVDEVVKVASSLIEGFDSKKKLADQSPDALLKFIALSSKVTELTTSASAGAVETTEEHKVNTPRVKEVTFPGLTIKNRKAK